MSVVVVMGVSGCGKTTVAALLAVSLGWNLLEGDAFHPPANVAKMAAGTPLTDTDRWPWLRAIAAAIDGAPSVVACSALKRAYRDVLIGDRTDARLVYLTTSVAAAPRAFWGGCAASKAAAETLVDCYAQELRNISKVRVAIVDPGATRTAMRARAYPGEDPASVKPPEDVARRLVALLSEPFVTGHRERVNSVP